MKYTKADLRNSNLALLRRVQRQTDRKNSDANLINSKVFGKRGHTITTKSKSASSSPTPKKLNLFDRRNMF